MLNKEMELVASYYSRIPPTRATALLLGVQLARFHFIHSSWASVSRKVETEYGRRVAVLLAECLRCRCTEPEFRSNVGIFAEQARSLLSGGGMLELIFIISNTPSSALTISRPNSCTSSSSSSSFSFSSSSSSVPSLIQTEVIRNLLSGVEPSNFEPRDCFRLALLAAEADGSLMRDCFAECGKRLQSVELPKEVTTILSRIGQTAKYFNELLDVSPGMLKVAFAQSVEEVDFIGGNEAAHSQDLAEDAFFVDTAGDEHVRGVFKKKKRAADQ